VSHFPAKVSLDTMPGSNSQPYCAWDHLAYNSVKFVNGRHRNHRIERGIAVASWLRNIVRVVVTVAGALCVTLRSWVRTYCPRRRTFTEQFEYPELPLVVADRYRGFHRYDASLCGGCGACARDCPVDCIYIDRHRRESGKGFLITSFTIDYAKCMFCALCTEACPTKCLVMGATHDLSCYSRDGCLVDFARIPPEVAWGRATLNPAAVAESKLITEPIYSGPGD
jgi:NADH-quinone oxidoreductase subunit I